MVSSDYSAYAKYRVESGNPYTCTTTASIFYYFGWSGLVALYPLFGLLYGKLVQYIVKSIRYYRILEIMISIKILSSVHGLLFSSDLYIISYKGLLYVLLLVILQELKKRKMKIVLKQEVIHE